MLSEEEEGEDTEKAAREEMSLSGVEEDGEFGILATNDLAFFPNLSINEKGSGGKLMGGWLGYKISLFHIAFFFLPIFAKRLANSNLCSVLKLTLEMGI